MKNKNKKNVKIIIKNLGESQIQTNKCNKWWHGKLPEAGWNSCVCVWRGRGKNDLVESSFI